MKLPTLIGSCLLFFLCGAVAQAQSTTGSTKVSVTIFPKTGLCRYPLLVDEDYSASLTSTPQPVGILSICSNYGGGFDLSVSSKNDGILVHTEDKNYGFAYEVQGVPASAIPTWNGRGEDLGDNTKATLSDQPFQPKKVPKNFVVVDKNVICSTNGAGKNGCDVGLQWRITSTEPMPGGIYQDTLTYTLTEKEK